MKIGSKPQSQAQNQAQTQQTTVKGGCTQSQTKDTFQKTSVVGLKGKLGMGTKACGQAQGSQAQSASQQSQTFQGGTQTKL